MFLSKAVAQLAGEYDVVHVHDWNSFCADAVTPAALGDSHAQCYNP